MVLAVVVTVAAIALVAFGSSLYRFQRDLVRMRQAGTAEGFLAPHDLLQPR